MAIASTTYPSSNSSMSLFAGPPADMTNNQLQATWQAVEQQAHALPSDQREHSEDVALMQLYRSGKISADDLDSLLTNAADQNPQVDPGKEAVARLEAEGLKLTGQQKDAIEKSARNQAAQAKVADAERLLNIERSQPGQDPMQALSIGVTIFDANGNQQHLLVRNAGPGANSIQQIHDLGDGYRDQVLIDAAEDQLEAEMAATPLDQRKKLSEKVHAPGGTYDVTLDTNGKLNVTKETGFWGSILHGLEAIAPIALAAIPGVGPIAAAAYLGATGGYDIANGNVAAGLADIAGGIAGVGGFIGGATGAAIQDAATVTQYSDEAYSAASSGNVLGVIDEAVGALGAIPSVGPVAAAASVGATGGYDIANGNVAAGLADIAGGIAGVGGLIGGATGAAIQDAATVTQYGDQAYGAASSGNVVGVINEAVGALGAIPGVEPIAASASLGATGGYDIANGNVAAGLADIAGGMAGVGEFMGGATGAAIQDAATVTQYGDQAYSAASSGNVMGVIDEAVGALGAIPGVGPIDAASPGATGGYDIANRNVAAGPADIAGGMAGVGETGSAIRDAATVTHGAANSGNVSAVIDEAVKLVSVLGEILRADSIEQAGQALADVAQLQFDSRHATE